MYCEKCGAPVEEVRPNEYHCNFCNHTFSVAGAAPAQPQQAADTEGKPAKLSGEQIYDQAIKSVVEIYASNRGSSHGSCASGFVVSEQGFVITNAHAVLDDNGQVCSDIRIKTQKGIFSASVVAIGKPADNRNNNVDLCLLYSEGLTITPDSFGDIDTVKNGQRVYLIGNSLGMGSCITSGIVSDRARAMPGLQYPYIMTDVAANHGNSGGPLYNEQGEVIGVLVAGIDHAEGMNYAIPVNIVDGFMQYILQNSKLSQANIDMFSRYKCASNYSTAALTNLFSGVKIALDIVMLLLAVFA